MQPYIEILKGIKLPERKPEPLEELAPERLYSLAHQVTEAMQRLRHQLEDDEDLEEEEIEEQDS